MNMEKIHFEPVGIVKNDFNEPTDWREIKSKSSTILIYPQWQDALSNIEACEYIDIVFHFHKSKDYDLIHNIPSGARRGVFASRSPRRPNGIGITSVKLIRQTCGSLMVEGLDAINNTPVLDIKCCDTSLFANESDVNPVHNTILKSDPRIDIRNLIHNNNTELLMLKAGVLHGHYCPGLAMGIMAACYAMNELLTDSDGMEDLLAITETNNCFSDGVQFVTGCSFGNNALIFRDIGKTAFTLTRRDGKGVRICSRHESRVIIQKAFPDFSELYRQVVEEQNHDTELVATYKKTALNRAFGTLTIPFEELFTVQKPSVTIPDYAPIHESVICASCDESVMKSRSTQVNNKYYCFSCNNDSHGILDGHGIHF